jgi:outer membrane receptor protein involved in Fe transport
MGMTSATAASIHPDRHADGSRNFPRAGVLLLLSIVLLLCGISAHAAAFLNRRVSDVLNELRGAGFVFIYSTDTIPAQLRVVAEPRAAGGIELAREILRPHGLALIEAAPKVYSVVHDTANSRTIEDQPRPINNPVEEIVVQTSRYSLNNDYAASTAFLTQDQIKDLPQLAGETLRAVQRLPGTATNGFSSVGPVRGGEPGEMAIILDGLRLYEPFHLKNFLSPVSLLDSRLIEGIEFYSGGFPAIYGDRMSAIIDARSVHPGQPRYYELGFNLFHASALGSIAFDDARGHALLSYRRSNLGELAQFSENEVGEPNYQDAFGRLDYTLSDQTNASFEMLVSNDAISAIRADEMQRARAEYRNVYAWMTLEHRWTEAADSRFIVSYTDLSNERRGNINEPTRAATVRDDRTFHVLGFRWENSFATNLLQHRFGVEGRRLWGQYDYASDVSLAAGTPFPDSLAVRIQRESSPEPQGYEALAYWDVRADLGERWTFQGGMRVDTQTYDGSDDGEQLSPRLSAMYAFTPHSHLRASWGRFYQAQGINELQVEDGIEHFYPAQFADHFIVGFDHEFETGFDLRIEAYRKRYRRLNPRFENLFDPLVLFPEAEFDRVMIDPESARAFGIETLLRLRQRGSWSGWLSYTWSQVEDRIDGRDVPRSWDQRHAINLGVVWSKGPWTASLANSYHSGWPTTALSVDASGAAPQLSLTSRNRTRFAAFNSLDLRVTRVFALSHGVLDVFAEVTNATSRENPCCVQYERGNAAGGGALYDRDVDSWLPLVPSAGVLWRY